jgi:hypothetical protein
MVFCPVIVVVTLESRVARCVHCDEDVGTLHEDQYTFFNKSRSFLLRVRNVSDKSCRENQNTFCVQ